MGPSGEAPSKARLRRGLERAEAAKKDRDYAEALRLYSLLADEFPDNPDVLRQRSDAFEQLDDFDSAAADITRLLELEPDNIGLYFGRGDLWIRAGKPEKAVEDLSLVIESGNYFTLEAAYFFRAVAYLQLREFDKALADCRHVADDCNLGLFHRYEWKTKGDVVRAAEVELRQLRTVPSQQPRPKRKR